MTLKVFLDANVILDFLLQRPNYADAKKLIQLALDGKLLAHISPSILHISAYWLTKEYGYIKAKALLTELLGTITCLEIKYDEVRHALMSDMTDIEDAIQYFTALSHGLDCIVSRDKTFTRVVGILPVYSPETFFQTYNRIL